MKKTGLQLQDFSADQLLKLIDIYLGDWSHRDELLWSRIFKFFYATLVVLFLPNISNFLGIELPSLPSLVFRFVSLVMSLFFLYVFYGQAKRVESCIKSYHQLIDLLPHELQRISFSKSNKKIGKYFNRSLNTVLACLMFCALFTISIVMIILDVTGIIPVVA